MREMLDGHRIIPVITLHRVEDAVPLAEALVAGGLKVLEVLLRTDAAMDGIREMLRAVPEAMVGSGTVYRPEQVVESEQAGCHFMVSPGCTDKLLDAVDRSSVPMLPGVATVSEMLRVREYGYRDFKFFPAEASGGIKALSSIAGPFPDIRFCPTGGISPANLQDYLKQSCVMAVGGTWVAPVKLIEEKNWAAIEELARQAAALANQ